MPKVKIPHPMSGELASDYFVEIEKGFYLTKVGNNINSFISMLVTKHPITLQQFHKAMIDAVDSKLAAAQCPIQIAHSICDNMPYLTMYICMYFCFGEYENPSTEYNGLSKRRFGIRIEGSFAPKKLRIFRKRLAENRPDVAKFLAENELFYLWRSDQVPIRTVVATPEIEIADIKLPLKMAYVYNDDSKASNIVYL